MRVGWFVLIVAALVGCDPGGFKVQVGGSDQTLRSVFVSSNASAFIAGMNGTVLDFDGENFVDTSTDADPGPRIPSFFACARATNQSFVGGDDGNLLVRNGAGDFLHDDINANQRLLMMVAATPTIVYAGGEGGRLYRRLNGSWDRVDVPVPGDSKITGGWAISQETIVLTTDQGLVLDSVGGDWVAETVVTDTSTTPLPLFGVWSSTAASDLYAVGLGGAIYRRSPPAFDWERQESPTTQDLYAIHGDAPDRIFAVGASGTIVRFDGAEWKVAPSGTAEDLFAIHGTGDGDFIVAVGARGAIVTLRE